MPHTLTHTVTHSWGVLQNLRITAISSMFSTTLRGGYYYLCMSYWETGSETGSHLLKVTQLQVPPLGSCPMG